MKQILKSCLLNVIAACKKYDVPFDVLLTEIAFEKLSKKADKMAGIDERKTNRI